MLILYLLLLMYMLYVHLMQMLNLCGAGRKSWKANFWQTRPRPGYGLTVPPPPRWSRPGLANSPRRECEPLSREDGHS